VKEVIMKVPSFSADYPKAPIYVAELVRCKECKHRYVHEKGMTRYYVCDFLDAENRDDGFCSYGAKKGADDEKSV
jgi:hypothetical protein